MASEAYLKLLRDPRWQKKRLAVMKRDKWTCRKCSDKKTTLNVHHLKYKAGRPPWEYDISDLLTLCEKCHERISRISRDLDSIASWHDLDPVQALCGISMALRVSSASHETEEIVVAHPSGTALAAIGQTLDGLARLTGFAGAIPIMGLLIGGTEPTLRLERLVNSVAATLDPEGWSKATGTEEASP